MSKRAFIILISCFAVLAVFVVLRLVAVVSTDYLWFSELGFRDTFVTVIRTKTLVLFAFGSAFALICGVSIFAARYYGQPTRIMALQVVIDGDVAMPPDHARRQQYAWIGIIALLSFFMGVAGTSSWIVVLKYAHPSSFGLADPIFGRDIAFYAFRLPLYNFLQGWLIAALIVTGIATVVSYHRDRAIRYDDKRWITIPHVRAHVSILAAGIALLLAWGYWLKEYELLYSSRKEAFFGAGYTDLNIQILAYRAMLVGLVALALSLAYNVRVRTWKIPGFGAAAYLGALVVLSWFAPMAFELVVVRANEFDREAPYIRHAIDYTRTAYALDKIEEVPFPGESDLTASDIETNQATIQSIPLWDRRPLMDTYSQIQEIRSYYKFRSVDVDRYRIDGAYRQVMLAARELARNPRDLPGDTWVNRHLVYTHGYGLVMSPANEIAAEGLPGFLLKDIPPATSPGLVVARPELYYGEDMRDYVIVQTNTPEFDYPKGDENIYTTYKGRGGVPMGGFLTRLGFALRFADPFILFTDAITAQSRIIFDRHIGTRFGETAPRRFDKIAPFLHFDSDPYLALVDQRLVWIQDAYTVSNMFPYSMPYGRPYVREMNYIRNSVKVVLDAYHGSVTFYAWDPTDPLLETYMAIFPDLFKSADEIRPSLRAHLRYPLDLFDIQASLYNTYHMTTPIVFYNREDVWEIPTEYYGTMDRPIRMRPYYVMARLPGEEREEYILMLPATPSNKPNMIGWIFARCDGENYGQLVVYKLPKEKLIYGPMLIEQRINQDTDISREITLWDQRGSDVIRGNLLVIPIRNSFIYVEPLYLRASQHGMPELKRVLAIHGDRLAMGEDLDDALDRVFANSDVPPPDAQLPEDLEALARQAYRQFETAQKHLRAGAFSDYGHSIDALRQTLRRMNGEK